VIFTLHTFCTYELNYCVGHLITKILIGMAQGHISLSNIRAYRVFNKSTELVEVSCDILFDETNGSQVEQVDLDELDDEEAPCVTLRNMSIGDVYPKEPEEPSQAQDQPSSSIQASPPTQDEELAQEEEDQDDDNEPPQEEDIDKGEMKLIKKGRMNKKFKMKAHRTQESTKPFNEITPSTPYLVTLKGGNHSISSYSFL
jgi:hypothetical protein